VSTKRPESPLHGILLIDKPSGWTSHDVVARARRITGQRRIGHTGTLDPMATGLLVLCLGNATRLVQYLTGHDKRYSGEIALGVTTTTADAEGEPTATRPVPPLDEATLRTIEQRFTGDLQQAPPAFSAIKVEGRRAYDLARAGELSGLPPRPVRIHSLQLATIAPGRLSIEVHCGAGTYIRSLARDIGEVIGCGGHLAALRRHSAGPFSLGTAITLDELQEYAAGSELPGLLLPPDEGIVDHPAAIIAADGARRFRNGLMHRGEAVRQAPITAARVYSTEGDFLGVADVSDSGEIRPAKVFAASN
jgi:tRNA pseudouridine55 synthase